MFPETMGYIPDHPSMELDTPHRVVVYMAAMQLRTLEVEPCLIHHLLYMLLPSPHPHHPTPALTLYNCVTRQVRGPSPSSLTPHPHRCGDHTLSTAGLQGFVSLTSSLSLPRRSLHCSSILPPLLLLLLLNPTPLPGSPHFLLIACWMTSE